MIYRAGPRGLPQILVSQKFGKEVDGVDGQEGVGARRSFLQTKPNVCSLSAGNSRAGNGCTNFVGAWDVLVP